MHKLDYLEVKTHSVPDSSVIWLHGLGADGRDFESLASELHLPEKLRVHFIFPHAPIQPVSINAGFPMRSWFNIFSLDEHARQDEIGIRKSQELIEHIINDVVTKGIPSKRIIIGGFSQGGALALHTALRYPQKLGGAISLSSFLPLADTLTAQRHTTNSSVPIFLGHGTKDSIVPYKFGEMCFRLLKEMQYPVSWHKYEIGHSVNLEEIRDISIWLQEVLMS
jgi:phospholipase/carboxylesterase